MIQCYYYFPITILIDETSNIRPLKQRNIPSIDPKRAVPSYISAAITLQ